jgi:hypothetical protein
MCPEVYKQWREIELFHSETIKIRREINLNGHKKKSMTTYANVTVVFEQFLVL